MYRIGRRVWVKPFQCLATVAEANYVGKPRHTVYVVNLENGGDYMCGPSSLRGADYGCDGCGKYWPGQPHAYGQDGEYPRGLQFCFLCSGEPAARQARRLEYEVMEAER